MTTGSIEHKIKKYEYKLANCSSTKIAEVYQQKLSSYRQQLGQVGGVLKRYGRDELRDAHIRGRRFHEVANEIGARPEPGLTEEHRRQIRDIMDRARDAVNGETGPEVRAILGRLIDETAGTVEYKRDLEKALEPYMDLNPEDFNRVVNCGAIIDEVINMFNELDIADLINPEFRAYMILSTLHVLQDTEEGESAAVIGNQFARAFEPVLRQLFNAEGNFVGNVDDELQEKTHQVLQSMGYRGEADPARKMFNAGTSEVAELLEQLTGAILRGDGNPRIEQLTARDVRQRLIDQRDALEEGNPLRDEYDAQIRIVEDFIGRNEGGELNEENLDQVTQFISIIRVEDDVDRRHREWAVAPTRGEG